jgi:hypothetical protein
MSHSRQDLLAFVVDYLSDTFTRHGIWHALAYGTLLGAVRDGDIIAWDYDIDFFIRPMDLARVEALNAVMAADGFAVRRTTMSASALAINPLGASGGSGPRLTVQYQERTVGDLYAFSLFSDGILRWYDVEHELYWCPDSSFPHYFVETLEPVTLRGKRYPGPRAAEQWLDGTYGAEWRTPFQAGDPRPAGTNVWGYRFQPRLAAEVAWCEAQGWDRSRYRGELQWPRDMIGAGPQGWAPRGASPDEVRWWNTLAVLAREY